MSTFKDRVLEVIKKIPSGKVASYGQIALYVGLPRAARQVGYVLNQNHDESVPWWRIVNNEGRISIKGSEYSSLDQKERLKDEGVFVSDDLTLEIEEYRFEPSEEFVKNLKLDSSYLEMIADKIYFSMPRAGKK